MGAKRYELSDEQVGTDQRNVSQSKNGKTAKRQ